MWVKVHTFTVQNISGGTMSFFTALVTSKIAAARNRAVVDALVAAAAATVLDVQVLEARHLSASHPTASSRP